MKEIQSFQNVNISRKYLCKNVIFVRNTEKNEEIRCFKNISLVFGWLSDLQGHLLSTWDQRLLLSKVGDVARFETQLEDYEELPDLFKEDDATKAKRELSEKQKLESEALPILLLAKGMDILVDYTDKNGEHRLRYIPEDEDGLPDMDNAIILASTIEKSLGKMNKELLSKLSIAVEKALKTSFRHVDKQAELRKEIASLVKQTMTAYDNDVENVVVKQFNTAFKVVKNKIESLNND